MRVRSYTDLYVHVPFCAAKCDYCGFHSVPLAEFADRVGPYLGKLRDDADRCADRCASLRSVYVGGGTPSVLAPEALRELLRCIARLARTADAEVSVECNPASLDRSRIEALAEGGVTRVSLGVQSWRQALRRTIGRATALGDPAKCVQMLRQAGIREVGADLIYAIPGQTVGQWREDVARAADLGVTSVSAYSLTVEEGTPLARRSLPECDDDRVVEMSIVAEQVLHEYGMHRYEVSNFAVPGHECRHNDRVWHGRPYVGLGPAACSFNGRDRFCNPPSADGWLEGHPGECDRLPDRARAAELLGIGLRTSRGWPVAEFAETTGFRVRDVGGEALRWLEERDLVHWNGTELRPTSRGLWFADTIAEALLLPQQRQ